MLMFLLMLCLLVGAACVLTRLAGLCFAQALPLTLTAASLLTYLFTAAGEKEWLVLLALPLAAAVVAAVRRGGRAAMPRPAFFAFLLAMAVVVAFTGHLQLTIFDDLAHWGLFTRQISGIDQFPAAAVSASAFSDYPPGLQMLAALLHLFSARVSVQTMFITQLLWYISLTLPLLADFGWSGRRLPDLLRVVGMAALLLVLPAFYTKYHQMSLVVEPLMALLLGWALLTAWRSPQPGFWDLAAASGALSLLAISKSTGPIYVAAGMAALAALWWEPLRQTLQKGSVWASLAAAAAVAAPPCFWLTWQVLCRLKGTSSYFTRDLSGGALSPANLLAFFTGQGETRSVALHYLQFFLLEPLNRGPGLSAFGMLALFWVLAWRLGRRLPARARQLRRAGGVLTVIFLGYALSLCYSYLFLFDPDEAQQLAAYHRYIAPLPVAMLFWALGALAPFVRLPAAPARRGLALAAAAAVFALGVNWTAATELVPSTFLAHRALDPEEANWAREQTELQPVFDSFPDVLREPETQTLVITDGPQWDHDCRLYKFDLAPGRTLALNPVEFGEGMAQKYAEWAAAGAQNYVLCAWDGEAVAAQLALTDADGAPLRANCLYRLQADGALVLEKELAAPAR